MKKVVLTGATGFIGSHLVHRLLENDYEVGILVRKTSNLSKLNDILDKINIYRVDNDLDEIIESFKEFEPECVIHLAAFFRGDHKKEDVNNLINTNINYPSLILEAMNQCGVNKIINIGTAWQHYNNEEYNPVCLYAATKEAFEKIIEYYVKALDFKCLTLTLFDSYGDNDDRGKLISILKDFSINNKVLNMTKGENKIDLTHVDDITNGIIKGIEYLNFINYGEHKKYALCTERILTLKEVIEIFEKETGYKLQVNWGGSKYRRREVMETWNRYKILPNWRSAISFEEGIKNIYK